jgi:glutamyl-Q tRNA(Asp) synthetase
MLRTLEVFGFEWDGAVLYQGTRREAYREALARLQVQGRIFECSCSRKQLSGGGGEDAPGYPGTCRRGPTRAGPTSRRFRVSDATVQFNDLFQGDQAFELRACGDVVVERRDGIASYQLAVVVDDEFQQVTRVIRGADLLSSTPWQIDLQDALAFHRPIYGHLPLVVEADGTKLSKSRHAIALDPSQVAKGLTQALTLLSQSPPDDLARFSLKDLWKWAFEHWNPQALAGRGTTRCPQPATWKQI